MAILMQGSWRIQVTQKNAARDQRFVVSGAALGNGVHPGVVGSPIVTITDAPNSSWQLIIQSKSGSTWINSTEKIQFPSSASSGFSIASDDTGASSDRDFNDLVIFCTPVASSGYTDYLNYGNVSCYEGFCRWNPCFRGYVVLDTPSALHDALKNPILRKYLEKIYPDRLFERPVKPPIPIPDPPPFTPLMLPIEQDALLPSKEATIFRKEKINAAAKASSENEAAENYVPVSSIRTTTASSQSHLSVSDRIKMAGIFDQVYLHCDVNPMGASIIRFLEYDRTAAELAGGAYTGTGHRQVLGYAITDSFGNYIFRFQRSTFDDLSEVNVDVASGESIFTQYKPDVIVQLLDASDPSVVLYESALYANISTFRRMNICFPCVSGVKPCRGQQGIIQYIGDLLVIKGTSGARGGDGNILGSTGKISNSYLKCAAWRGVLKLIACLENDAIKFYTVRFKRPADGSWSFVTEQCRLPRFNGIDPLPVATSIRRIRSLQIDGVMTSNVDCYEAVENAADANQWITTSNLKALLTTSTYLSRKEIDRGTMQFRIEGYDATGNKLAGVDETIDLYLDSNWVEADIDPNVSLGGSTLGDCALFTLPSTLINGVPMVTDERAPITIRFRAKLLSGYMGKYAISIGKGSTGLLTIGRTSPAPSVPLTTALPTGAGQTEIGREYSDSVQTVNCFFAGTPAEPGAVGDYTEITIRPDNNWLEPDQTFCAFKIALGGYLRHTDGEHHLPNYNTTDVLIGIQRP